jgi:hypothetical protein
MKKLAAPRCFTASKLTSTFQMIHVQAEVSSLALEMDGVLLGWERSGVFFGVAEGHDGTAGMGKDAIDGAIVREVVNDGMCGGAEYDEARIEFHGRGQNFDCGMTVGGARFDFSAA